MSIKVLKYSLTGLAAILVVVAIVLSGAFERAKFSSQSDETLHLAKKRAYLAVVARLPMLDKASCINDQKRKTPPSIRDAALSGSGFIAQGTFI